MHVTKDFLYPCALTVVSVERSLINRNEIRSVSLLILVFTEWNIQTSCRCQWIVKGARSTVNDGFDLKFTATAKTG
jgi:hypothetical protein